MTENAPLRHLYALAIITGILGVLLGAMIQARRDETERQRQDTAVAKEISEATTEMIGRRLYRMRRLTWAMRNGRSRRNMEGLSLVSGYKSKSRNWLHVDSSEIVSFAREKA